MNKHINFFLSVLTLPFLLYIITMSVYFSPYIQGVNLENDFKNVYISYSKRKPDPTSESQRRIQDIIDNIYRLRRSPDTSLEKAIWVGMLSGSENIALPSGAIHFYYLLKNDKTTSVYALVFLCLLYTSLFLVGVSGIWHNFLTYILRLDVIPTICYLRYAAQYFKNLSINNKKQSVSIKGYTKTLYAYLPYWLIGFIIGYINGDYHVYTQSPIIPNYLLVCASVYCVCIGSSLVLSINQIILFFFMRLNVDVVTKYVDDVICAGIAICISKWIFNNGIGTTIAVTLTTLLFTIIMNNRIRASNLDDNNKSEISAIGYANIGFHYHKKRKIQKAIEMFKKSIDIYTDLDLTNNTAPIYGSLGKAYFDKGDLGLAEDVLKKALALYSKRENSQEAITTITYLLRLISERRQNTDQPNKYTNSKLKFSIIIPNGWLKQRLDQGFINTGGQVAISHKTHRATFNISVGPPDQPEWVNKEARANALKTFLASTPGRIGNVETTNSLIVGGESNTVAAELKKIIVVSGAAKIRREGLISTIHNEIEYVLQWSAEFQFEKQVKKIIDSFKFET